MLPLNLWDLVEIHLHYDGRVFSLLGRVVAEDPVLLQINHPLNLRECEVEIVHRQGQFLLFSGHCLVHPQDTSILMPVESGTRPILPTLYY